MTNGRQLRFGEPLVEAAGSAALVAIVLWSGLGSSAVAGEGSVVAALMGSLFVGYGTSVLLLTCGPVSGAHLNPLVTLARMSQGGIRPGKGLLFCVAQLLGAGVAATTSSFAVARHATLSADPVAFSVRTLRELVATFGLFLIVWGVATRLRPAVVTAAVVGSYLAATFWMTGSSLFANPLVVVALVIVDAGKPAVLTTAAAALTGQIAGAAGGTLVARVVFGPLGRAAAAGRSDRGG